MTVALPTLGDARKILSEPQRARERQRQREGSSSLVRPRPDILPTDSSKAHTILVTHVAHAVTYIIRGGPEEMCANHIRTKCCSMQVQEKGVVEHGLR